MFCWGVTWKDGWEAAGEAGGRVACSVGGRQEAAVVADGQVAHSLGVSGRMVGSGGSG